MASKKPMWVASWVAAALLIAQIVLLVVLGGGDIDWFRYTGFGLWTVAAVFGWVPIYQFKKRGGVAKGDSYVRTTRIVDTGLYALIRHPQFAAWPLMSVALALISQHPLVIAMGAAAFVLACLDFRKVDARNISKFGEEYRDYMERVPGWNIVAGMWRWVRRKARSSG